VTLAISSHGLSKQYRLGDVESGFKRLRRTVLRRSGSGMMWALDDLTFDVREGETLALVGRNGAGKSTLLKVLARITEPTSGYVDVRGRVGALLEVGTGFHGQLTGRQNVYLNGSILGMTRAEVKRNFDRIVEFSGVEKHIDTPVKWYSSGMYVRLAFAVAAHLEPEILIVDEVLAVGDAEFQRRCLGRMSEVAREGRTVLFVSHNMQAVRALCERAILLEHGRMTDDGSTDAIVRRYLASIEPADSGVRRWEVPASRPGTDECRLVQVRVTDDAGDPGSSFFSSQRISVVVDLDMLEPDPGLVLAVDIVSADGTTVFRSYSTDDEDGPQFGRRTGPLAVRCPIPAEFLNAGRYIVNVRVHVRGIDGIINEQGVLHFDVSADHGSSYYLDTHHVRPGVVAPVLTWDEVEPDEAEGALTVRPTAAGG
jgi:homopolymeric O-antigen transport system ATP-binding protein